MKYCTDCKHFKKDYEWKFLLIPIIGQIAFLMLFLTKDHIKYGKCLKDPKPGGDSLLDKRFNSSLYHFASLTRHYNCGIDAKMFEPKEVTTFSDRIRNLF
jgi:hypothetical protein